MEFPRVVLLVQMGMKSVVPVPPRVAGLVKAWPGAGPPNGTRLLEPLAAPAAVFAAVTELLNRTARAA